MPDPLEVKEPVDETARFEVVSSDVVTLEAHPEVKKEEVDAAGEVKKPVVDPEEKKEVEGDDKKDDLPTGEKPPAKDTEKQKQKPGFQKRINKLTREREEAKRESEGTTRELEKANRKIEELSKKPAAKPEPKESEFDTYDEYLSALDKFEKKPAEKPALDKPAEKKEDGPPELSDSQKTAMAVIQEAVKSSDGPDDFEEVALNDQVPISPEMLEAISECEDPKKVLYALGKDIPLAQSISEQSGAQQVRSILKLDLGKVIPPKPKTTTSSPDPIIPGGGSDAQQKSVNDMTFKEYEAHRNKQEESKEGGASW